MKFEIKNVIKAAICGFFVAVTFSLSSFFGSCEKITEEVLRLHVIANSDSKEDQAIKLKVRDSVLSESEKWYKNAEDFNEANSQICTHLQSIEKAANKALAAEGSTDRATVQITQMHFDTRNYEGFSLPAGEYRTLKIIIGEGEGTNWWCIVFPALCVPMSEKEDSDLFVGISENERDIIMNPSEYQIKFKLVEWYESIKRGFKE